MVIYTKILPVAGFTPLPNLMFINEQCRDDIPLLRHEEDHQRQMCRDGILTFWFRYALSKKHRQAYEVEAYKVQIAAGASLESCANHLVNMYYLGITIEEARELLK